MKHFIRSMALGLVAASLAVTAPTPVVAQSGGPGFLFRSPVVSLGIRMGYSMPRASSDVFDFTREQLTVDKEDFYGGYVGGELGVRVAPRVDVVFSAGHASTTTPSEFRDWVDLDDRPIEQTTRFTTTPVSLGLKYYLTDRGRTIGRFAWIPTKVNPYVGGGVGLVWHTFQQVGDFVDFETFDIFSSTISSEGVASQFHGLAGIDFSLNKNLYLNGEARYRWASGELNSGFFQDFDAMDLAGFQFTAGISVRF